MFSKIITNLTSNFKTKKINSSLFSNDSNSNRKASSFSDDFIDISKGSLEDGFHSKKTFSNSNHKEIINDFIKNITSIIFDSRKQKTNEFYINTGQNSNNINNDFDYNNNSFNLEVDDLFLYDDCYQEKDDFQKLVIEFYLTKKTKNKILHELVEKWKLTYKSENEETNFQKLKTKMNIYTKSIIAYSRLLPLYQYVASKNNNYSIDFKFYQNNSNKKGKFSQKYSGNVLLKNKEIFNLKTNIKYYTLKELKNIFEKKDKDILDINPINKIKSSSLNEKLFNNMNDFESLDDIYNDNKNVNDLNNGEKNIQSNKNEINKNEIKEELHDSNNSSFCLIFDSSEEKNRNINRKETINKRKFSSLSNGYETTEDCSPRTSYMKSNYRTCENISEESISSNITRKSFIKTENNKINNILKEYANVKNMIENLNSTIFIKTNKFINYAKGCD